MTNEITSPTACGDAPIRDVETAVRELGALPVPVGAAAPLAPQGRPRTMLDHARDALNARMAKDDLRLVLENVVTYAAALESRVAELEAAQGTAFRASHDSIPMGLYTTAAEARKHCETEMRRDLPTVALDWIEDEEDGVAELVAAVGEDERATGYVVTPLEVASEYDEEADQ